MVTFSKKILWYLPTASGFWSDAVSQSDLILQYLSSALGFWSDEVFQFHDGAKNKSIFLL